MHSELKSTYKQLWPVHINYSVLEHVKVYNMIAKATTTRKGLFYFLLSLFSVFTPIDYSINIMGHRVQMGTGEEPAYKIMSIMDSLLYKRKLKDFGRANLRRNRTIPCEYHRKQTLPMN